MKIKNKKSSHVGMIISFVVFITFIVFLYSVIRPAISTGQDKKTIADYLVVKIIENVSSNLTSTSIEIDSHHNPNKDCIILKNIMAISELVPEPPIPYMIIKNEDGNEQEAHNNYPTFDADLKIMRDSRSDKFFRIYYSPEFPRLISDSTSGCRAIELNDYSISIIKTGKFSFESNLNYLINHYEGNYEQLKTELNVPPGTEFGFGFIQSNGTRIDVGEIPSTADVYAAEIPIQYIDNSVNIQSGFINIKVW